MNAYVESSVLLRKLLGEPDPLEEWTQAEVCVSSQLLRVECLRTLDRLRLRRLLDDEEMALRLEALHAAFESIHLIEVGPEVLDRAGQPFPTSLGTLDAIHLSSAILWQIYEKVPLILFTHDRELALAARAHGIPVVGY
ncbi:PIN domain-containing protein [Acidobacteria bacterium AH-259-L09]|nr:PIN domain-containing protein [Acidobacteria bacterium AH-259-L09]